MPMEEKKLTWLKQYQYLVREGERINNEIARWRSIAERMTASTSLAPGGQPADGTSLEVAVEKIAGLEEMLAGELVATVALRRQIEAAIQNIPKPLHQELLRYRYIEGLTWGRVADKMHYTEQYMRIAHRDAVDALTMQ